VVITTREAASLALDVATVLPSSAQIQRATTASDGAGGRTRVFATVATVKCRVTPERDGGKMREIIAADHIKDKELYRVAFPAATDIRITDRVLVDGLTLSVEAVMAPSSVEVERVVFTTRAAV
jgi:head-tail adaptor